METQVTHILYGTRSWADRCTSLLLLAGQYEAAESGWAYNLFRYYSPTLGGYDAQAPLRQAPRLASARQTLRNLPPTRLQDPVGFRCRRTTRHPPKSRAPHTHPQAVHEALRKHIIDIRIQLTRAGFDAGPDTIAFHLHRQGLREPSTSTIRRIITDARLVTPQPQKKPRSSYIRFEAGA